MTRRRPKNGRQMLLFAVAVLVSAAAALAIAILLFGHFGQTEGRILATTAILAGYGLLTLPAAVLRDQHRLTGLAAGVVTLAVTAAALSITGIWRDNAPDALGQAIGTATVWLAASVQIASLASRRAGQIPRLSRFLFAGSAVLAVVVASMFSALLWAELEGGAYIRTLGALVVLDVLLVVLQPILERARPATGTHRLRVVVAPAETIELTIDAPSLAAAAASAINKLERDGRRVLRIEVVA